MKKLSFLTTLLTALFSFTFAQTTFITSGTGTGEWNDFSTWKLENGETPTTAPTAQDHIVISHPVTHFAKDGYTHFGNVHITRHGAYEIISGFDPEAIYIFAGDQFKIEGSLITTADFQVAETNSEGMGTLELTSSSLSYFGDDLILEANAGLIAHSNVCGSSSSLNDVQFRGPGSYACGTGSIIVGASVRVWDENGQEITSIQQSRSNAESRVCEGFVFYGSDQGCQSEQALVRGDMEMTPGFALLDFTAELKQSATNLAWITNDELFYDYFIVEKSQDGNLFEVTGTIEAAGQASGTVEYAMTDDTPYPGVTYYRLKQTMMDGSFAYSDIVTVGNQSIGGLLTIFPNPNYTNLVNIKAGNFVGKERLNIQVRNMLGQPVMTQIVKANPAGELDYKLQHNLKEGTYVIVVSGKTQRVSQMLQVK